MDNFNFRDLLESIPQMVWSTGADGIGEYYNRSFQEYAGMSPEELRGWGWAEFVHPDDRQPTIDAWTKAFTTGSEYYFEYRLRRAADGAYRWHAGNARPLRDEAGTIVRWVGTCTDINDSKMAHDALRETVENLSLSMQVANAGAWEWNAVSSEERWSPELYALYQVDPQDPRPLFALWQSLIHPDDREMILARLDRALCERTDFNAEFRILRGDGQLRWISAHGRMSYDNLQRPVKLNGISIDITERKQADELLHESEAKLRALHESLRDAFVSVTMDGRIQDFNQAFQELLGYPADELRSKSYVDLTPEPWHDPEARIVTEQILAHGYSSVYEKEYVRKDGTLLPVELRTFLIRDAAGQPALMWAIVRDISERKQLEMQLLASEERFRSLMDLSPDIISIVTKDGTLAYNSPAALAIHGYTQEEMIGRNTFDLIHPDDQPFCTAYADRIFNGLPGPSSVQYRYRNKDGSYVWMEATAANQFDNPHIRGLIVISRDISERKLIEEMLRYSEEKFSKAFQNGPMLMTISDFATRQFIEVNEAFVQVSGYSRDEAIGRTPDELGWARLEDLEYVYRQLREEGRVAGLEVKVTGKAGESIWCQYHGEVIATSSGEMLMSIAQDITVRKQVQEALLLKNLVFDQSLAANSVSDRDGILTEVNKAFLKCWGYASKEEVIGKPIPHFLADPGKAAEIVEALICSGQWEGEYSARRKDGSLYTAHGLATVVRDENGAIIGFQSSVLDVTARKYAEEALALAKEAAEAANRAKSEFLANMSHEIRTPINGIMGMAQLLEYTEISPNQREYLEAIRAASESLLAIVNDILDLSRIESGQLVAERKEFSLRGIISDVVRNQIVLVHAKGLTLRVDIPAEVPDDLTGDPLRLKQILLNLLGNAVKFTEKGEIALSVAIDERHEDRACLCFAVADTGIGITPEAIERIFAPFIQADPSTTRRFGGSGLGLAICTRLAKLMGGTIGVESRLGVGSTFHVRIPFAVNDVQLEHSLPRPVVPPPLWEGRSLRVLLAEDNDAGRRFFAEALHRYGHRVDLARNGVEALQKWPQAAYDLILMDVQMPVMDGVEATVRIRKLELEKGGHVPIIALTAHAMEDDRSKLLAQGFDGYVAKPTKIRELLREMKRCLHDEQ